MAVTGFGSKVGRTRCGLWGTSLLLAWALATGSPSAASSWDAGVGNWTDDNNWNDGPPHPNRPPSPPPPRC
jgi:hypothetical protein